MFENNRERINSDDVSKDYKYKNLMEQKESILNVK